jgi:hypothetical protein
MPSGFSNQPKILRGAFVEFGISIPPLIVVFQFNPLTISRTRSARADRPATPLNMQGVKILDFAKQALETTFKGDFRAGQKITVNPETLSFDIRLDATDKLNEGDGLTEQFGIAPQLSTLELMMLPKSQGLLGAVVSSLLGVKKANFAFFDDAQNPPVILLVWGRKKVLPVNITNMSIKEEEFSTDLNPIRATVTVSLEVIEGGNLPFIYTKTLKEVMSLLNLANIGDIANTIVPA